ncbi:hypothetical protein JCM3774_003971 [Rhodotorula dairenensis]
MVQLNNTFEQLKVSEGGPAVQHRPSRPIKATPRLRQTGDADGAERAGDDDEAESTSSTQLLALLCRLFAPLRRSPNFSATLQHVKGLLYDKQYLAAFGTESEEGERWREVYAARWVPSRAVIYQRIFEECGIASHLGWQAPGEGGGLLDDRPRSEDDELELERERAKLRRRLRQEGQTADEISRAVDELDQELLLRRRSARTEGAQEGGGAESASSVVDAIMIGAGAGSEVVALASVLGASAPTGETTPEDSRSSATATGAPRVRVQAIDQGSWNVLLDKMAAGVRDEWPRLGSLGKDDGQEAPQFDVQFVKGDILDDKLVGVAAGSANSDRSDAAAAAAVVDFANPSLRLITICFTITELLLQSRLGTLRLFSNISRSAPTGTLLVIVESASLAQIPIGKEGRTYPLGKLLDHALCGGEGDAKEGGGAWEVLRSEDAKWYRMPDDADEVYNAIGKGTKVKLENSRVVLRVYRKR